MGHPAVGFVEAGRFDPPTSGGLHPLRYGAPLLVAVGALLCPDLGHPPDG